MKLARQAAVKAEERKLALSVLEQGVGAYPRLPQTPEEPDARSRAAASFTERSAARLRRVAPEERARAAIVAGNYGEAGAIDFFGARHGLPKALSGHNQYWYWGLRGQPEPEVIIRLNGSEEGLRKRCREVRQAGTFGVPYAMPYEQDAPIWVCKGLLRPLGEIWPEVGYMN